jgi:Zn-finger nucleic acid-binding protein
MKCPIDAAELVMSERSGIEIDYCPQCRGVWLDRGELDKIIDRAVAPTPAQPVEAPTQTRPSQPRYHDDDDYRSRDDGYHHKKKRKESFLGDMFDF